MSAAFSRKKRNPARGTLAGLAVVVCLSWMTISPTHALADESDVSAGAVSPREPSNPDPLEKINRGTFAFNEGLDKYFLSPLATAWDFVVPEFAQTGINNFYGHLNMPIVLANDILQGKPMAALQDVTRILHNTVFGLGGFIDFATIVGIPEKDEDFGQTLGVYGIPPGPYLMVPILGPYTLRDGVGEVVDTTASGFLYAPFWYQVAGLSPIETSGASIGQEGLELLNLRSIYDEELEESKKDAFDYYIFVRNAYLQNRRAKVADQTDGPVLDEEDLYFLDEEENGDEADDDEEEDYDDF